MPRLRQEPINLLNLPLEVQLQIYDYALSDPDLCDRRHRNGCNLCPLTQQEMNQPPFMWHRVVVDAVPKPGPREQVALSSNYGLPKAFSLAKTWTACDCGKRRGIHILRTNRYIFSVAAHMLWSRGSLCFFDATEFAACIEATSPGTRALIRGVRIMSLLNGETLDPRVCLRSQGDNGQERPSAVHPWEHRCLPEFWIALQLLPRLQHLTIPHRYLKGLQNMTDDQFFKTRAYLARLGCIYLTHLNLSPRDRGFTKTTPEISTSSGLPSSAAGPWHRCMVFPNVLIRPHGSTALRTFTLVMLSTVE
ncbi:hypothetical protein BBO_08826 [Beauveria brongniartii RCEF 3172]|uniref:F-box domain-containing protein n=1 Tax=Beauveria brongniartii RCEF 3172 TaxID=1081107 RepID=A0A166WYC9_9HYPO|nr:hypothetical protein BBO_08826 [Beauveria brongniartii RCEF 3172]